MDDGRLVVIATGWLDKAQRNERSCFIIFSDDEGRSWTRPREIHRGPERPEPINFGGQRLLIVPNDAPGFTCFSDDGSETWSEKKPFPALPDGRATYRHGTILAEGDTLAGVFMAEGAPDPSGWTAGSLIRRSCDGGRNWDEGIWLPRQWQVSEGSLARAPDGALVVSLRTAQAPGMPSYCDHWRRITTARSIDDRLTWTDHQVHFDYGKVHSGLLTLKKRRYPDDLRSADGRAGGRDLPRDRSRAQPRRRPDLELGPPLCALSLGYAPVDAQPGVDRIVRRADFHPLSLPLRRALEQRQFRLGGTGEHFGGDLVATGVAFSRAGWGGRCPLKDSGSMTARRIGSQAWQCLLKGCTASGGLHYYVFLADRGQFCAGRIHSLLDLPYIDASLDEEEATDSGRIARWGRAGG